VCEGPGGLTGEGTVLTHDYFPPSHAFAVGEYPPERMAVPIALACVDEAGTDATMPVLDVPARHGLRSLAAPIAPRATEPTAPKGSAHPRHESQRGARWRRPGPEQLASPAFGKTGEQVVDVEGHLGGHALLNKMLVAPRPLSAFEAGG